jgi:hypothetical protein
MTVQLVVHIDESSAMAVATVTEEQRTKKNEAIDACVRSLCKWPLLIVPLELVFVDDDKKLLQSPSLSSSGMSRATIGGGLYLCFFMYALSSSIFFFLHQS